jgi:ParB-like chromosome segregation protein Spo0J
MSESDVAGVEVSERFEIDPDLIDYIDGHQHRIQRDPAQDAMRLASMEHEGQFHDILVRRSKTEGRYELIDGEGRLNDAKQLKSKHIGARVVHADDGEAAILALQANDLRQSVNPMEYAAGLKRAIDKGLPLKDCLKRLGRVTADGKPDMHYGQEMLKLLELSPDEQEMVAKGIINKKQAVELSQLESSIRGRVIEAAIEIEGEKPAKAKKSKTPKLAKPSALKLTPSTGETPKAPATPKISQASVRKAKKKVGLKDGPRFIGMRPVKELEQKLEETEKLDDDQKKLVKKTIDYILGRRKTLPF